MITARYTNAEHSAIEITWDDGRVTRSPIPIRAGDIASPFAAWIAEGGVPQPFEAPAVDLLAYAADQRWRKEVGGITVAGIAIATDDRSKQMLLGARVAADANPSFETPWVASDGSIVTVNAAQIIAISNAVLAHVATCFATFATVKAGIDGATITTTAEIDAAFAP